MKRTNSGSPPQLEKKQKRSLHSHNLKRRVSLPTATPSRIQITDFELIKKIGQGGFGEVYLAKKKYTNEIVALKIMQKSIIWTRDKKKQVKNERDVLAQGTFDHLVRLHYSFQDPHYLYLAMEYCPGGDLYHLVEKLGRLDEDEARLYIAEMIVAIHSLHNIGYIHRDLKPDNFLIDGKGHIKLTDFGLSKEGLSHFKEDSPGFKNIKSKTDSKQSPGFYSIVGSPHYMAPEIINLAPNGYGKEVDWWSLGCLIFEMVTGNPPFEGNTPEEVFDKIASWRTELPKLFSQFHQHLSEEFMDLISGFLCDPEKRLGSDINILKRHIFFGSIDWDNLRNIKPLFIPQIDHPYDVSYFESNNNNILSPSKTTHRFSRYYKKCLKKTDRACNILQVQLQRFHRSRSIDISELHAYNVPWVSPFKKNTLRHSTGPRDRIDKNMMITPIRDSPITPCSDKQILGFTFQRKQTSRVREVQKTSLPTFKLTAEITEQKNIDRTLDT